MVEAGEVTCHLRDCLVTAIEQQDEKSLDEVESALYAVQETIIALHPRNAAHLLLPIDHMISAVQDYFHGETWKSTIPTVEEIKRAFRGEKSERLE